MALGRVDVLGKALFDHPLLFVSLFNRLIDIDFVVLDVILFHLFLELVDFLARWDQPKEEEREEGATETDCH